VDPAAGAAYNRGLADSNDNELGPSLTPWTNGVKEVKRKDVWGADWNYLLVFELFAPLRNTMMYEPEGLSQTQWDTHTKALVDCHIKDADSLNGGPPLVAWSTSNIYAILRDPKNNDVNTGEPMGTGNISSYVLQWVEEAAQDLICLVTDINDHACHEIRTKWQLSSGQYSNCWVAGYTGIYGSAPALNSTLSTTTYCPTCFEHAPDVEVEEPVAPEEPFGPGKEHKNSGTATTVLGSTIIVICIAALGIMFFHPQSNGRPNITYRDAASDACDLRFAKQMLADTPGQTPAPHMEPAVAAPMTDQVAQAV
jgi:hypothetical protein